MTKKSRKVLAIIASALALSSCAGNVSTPEYSITNSEVELPSVHSSSTYTESMNIIGEAATAVDTSIEELCAWRAINSNVFAIIECEELSIRYPVLLASDNSEYLRTNIYLQKDSAGAIFLDYRCDENSLIKLIHGHNMKNNTMFGNLPDLLNIGDCVEAPRIHLYTDRGKAVYEIFSIMSVNAKTEALPLPTFTTSRDIRALAQDLLGRSLITGGSVHSDELLLLNTCWYGESGTERFLHCIVSASRIE